MDIIRESELVFTSKELGLKLTVDSVEDYSGNGINIKGDVEHNGITYGGEINCDEDGNYLCYDFYTVTDNGRGTSHADQYLDDEADEDSLDDLNEFFAQVAEILVNEIES